MTKLFNTLILMTCMVLSFANLDAQRPKGHRWYGGGNGSLEVLNEQIKGGSWSKDWRISREEAVNTYVFNLNQGFKMLGSNSEFGIPEFMHVLENSSVQTLPPGTVFTNTLVRDGEGKAVAFIDTVGQDGEKFFVYTDNKTGSKIAWAKATCMQSTLLVSKGDTPLQPSPTPTQTVYAQTLDVNVTTGDVVVEAPIVTVVDSGDTYITNNYNQPAARTDEVPYYNQNYSQPMPQQFGYGVGGGAGLYAQASFGWGMQQPFCGNTWGNSMYYGPRTGGGIVCGGNGGGGSNSNNQPVNVYVDVYNNNTNTNTSTSTSTSNVEGPFWQMPHYYFPHNPTDPGGPVDPGNGNPPTGGTGTGGGPIDPENKPVRGYATKGGGRQANSFTTPTTSSTGPRSTQSSVTTSTNDVSAKRGVIRGTTIARNVTPAFSRSNNNTLVQRGVGPARNAQSTQATSPRTVAVSRNANQQSAAAVVRGGVGSQQNRMSQAKQLRSSAPNTQQYTSQNRSFAQPQPRQQQHMQSSQMRSRPANNMGGNRMTAPRPSGSSVGMRR